MQGTLARRRTAGVATGLLVLALAAGCAWWKEPDPPAFQRVVLQSEVQRNSDGRLKGDLHADTTLKSSLVTAGALGVTGAGIGAWTGLSCSASGPFGVALTPICVAVFAATGFVIGGVTGAVVGGIGGLPRKTAAQVNEILDGLQSRRDVRSEIQLAIQSNVPREKQVGSDQAEAVVTARLDSIDLRQHYSERLSIRFFGSMTQEWDRRIGPPKKRTCKYAYTTPTRDVEDWLLDGGKLFDVAFTDAVNSFGYWMARDLEAFAMRRPQPASEGAPATCYQE
jgi:hypothetical protein